MCLFCRPLLSCVTIMNNCEWERESTCTETWDWRVARAGEMLNVFACQRCVYCRQSRFRKIPQTKPCTYGLWPTLKCTGVRAREFRWIYGNEKLTWLTISVDVCSIDKNRLADKQCKWVESVVFLMMVSVISFWGLTPNIRQRNGKQSQAHIPTKVTQSITHSTRERERERAHRERCVALRENQ